MINKAFLSEWAIVLRLLPRLLSTWTVNKRLTSIQRFRLFGYDTFLLEAGQSAAAKGDILVLGGYLGDSPASWLELGASHISVFEPVPAFVSALQARFGGDPRVEVIPAAAGVTNGKIELNLAADRTSFDLADRGSQKIEVPVLDFDQWLQRQSKDFSLVEINIEGAEYELLSSLSDSSMRKLRQLHLQCHNVDQKMEKLANLEEKLSKTHNKLIDFEFVWSVWVSK